MDSTFLVPYLYDLFTHLITLAVGDLGPWQGEVASLPALQEFPATFLFPQLPLKDKTSYLSEDDLLHRFTFWQKP